MDGKVILTSRKLNLYILFTNYDFYQSNPIANAVRGNAPWARQDFPNFWARSHPQDRCTELWHEISGEIMCLSLYTPACCRVVVCKQRSVGRVV